MENKNNQTLWIAGGIIVIVLILIVVFTRGKNSDVGVEQSEQSVVVESTEDTTEGSIHAVSIAGSSGTTTEEQRLTYQEAIETYTDKRIQFNEQCQATPFQVVYKNGTYIMLDNRSPESRTFNVGGQISIKGWGFKIIQLSSTTFPKALIVDCGSKQNVATVVIEK